MENIKKCFEEFCGTESFNEFCNCLLIADQLFNWQKIVIYHFNKESGFILPCDYDKLKTILVEDDQFLFGELKAITQYIDPDCLLNNQLDAALKCISKSRMPGEIKTACLALATILPEAAEPVYITKMQNLMTKEAMRSVLDGKTIYYFQSQDLGLSILSHVQNGAKVFFLTNDFVVISKDNYIKKYYQREGQWSRGIVDIALFEDYSPIETNQQLV